MSHQPRSPAPAWMRWALSVMAVAIAGLAVAVAIMVGDDGPPAAATAPTTIASVPSTTLQASTTIPPAATEAVYTVVGVSGLGRDILATTFGDGATRVYVMVGIHGDERAAVDTGPLLVEHWLQGGVPEGVTIRYLANANPDGVVAATRVNGAGVDLNRSFPTDDFEPGGEHGEYPLSEPESAALFGDIAAFAPDLIVTLHCEWNGPFANYDGPAERYAEAFAAAAGVIDSEWRVEPEVPYPTPGSLGTYYGKTLGIGVVTVEMSRLRTAAEHWPALRAGIDALLVLAAGA
ncbi:MAG: succinylglutamate desuccinylase/aspartoacylase family protein [Actinomycetota bacterium]